MAIFTKERGRLARVLLIAETRKPLRRRRFLISALFAALRFTCLPLQLIIDMLLLAP
jgi:hypothetical protein